MWKSKIKFWKRFETKLIHRSDENEEDGDEEQDQRENNAATQRAQELEFFGLFTNTQKRVSCEWFNLEN